MCCGQTGCPSPDVVKSSTTAPDTGTVNIVPQTPAPCPTCGRCPTCGQVKPFTTPYPIPPYVWPFPNTTGPYWSVLPNGGLQVTYSNHSGVSS